MKQEGLLFFTDTWMTLIGLVVFFTFFVYMIIKVKRTSSEYFEFMEKLPMEDSNK